MDNEYTHQPLKKQEPKQLKPITAFKKQFDEALPPNGAHNILALGELLPSERRKKPDATQSQEKLDNFQLQEKAALIQLYKSTNHLKWLQDNLPNIKNDYDVTTIGIQYPPFLNPLFWAYKDGILAARLGGPEQAKTYLKSVLIAFTSADFRANASAKADLLMAAMDADIEIVAYDSRDSYQAECNKEERAKKERASIGSADLNPIPDAAEQQQHRTDAEFLKEMSNRSVKEARPWIIQEVAWLKQLKPIYAQEFEATEKLINDAHEMATKKNLRGDALSATLFHALTKLNNGNRITIGSTNHINGIGYHVLSKKSAIDTVDGTFAHHLLEAKDLGPTAIPPKVTAAVISTTEVADHINSELRKKFDPDNLTALKDTKLVRIDLTSGQISTMWQPSSQHPNVISFENKIAPLTGIAPLTVRRVEANKYADPLILPTIKALADKVSELNAQRTDKDGSRSIPKPAKGYEEVISQQKADRANSGPGTPGG